MSEIDQQLNTALDDGIERPLSELPSPGQKLQKLREERGLSHHRVAEALHMTAHYVKLLESNQYDKLPGKTFVKGYFKAYARLLDTNVDEVMQCYEQYVAALEESQESVADEIRAKKAFDQNLRWLICAAVIIVLVVGVSWWMSRSETTAAVVAGSTNGVVANAEVTQSSTSDMTLPVTAEALVATFENRPDGNIENAPLNKSTSLNLEANNIDNSYRALAESSENQTDLQFTDEAITSPVEITLETSPVLSSSAGQNPGQTQQNEESSEVPVQSRQAEITSANNTAVITQSPRDYSVTRIEDHRNVQLESDGDDLLVVHFSGASWIEVDNGDNTRLYHDMLNMGDDLTIRGKAPFNILVGDANKVEMTFNSRSVDVLSRARTDNSARIILAPEPL